jgi:hypothetical protein
MALHIRFQPSTEMPTGSRAREAERLALADRECLHLRFGEPCDPRQLREFYDVVDLVETFTDYARFLQQPVDAAAAQLADLDGWSGFTVSRTQWEHVILVNPCHAQVRRTLTIAHEFGHLVHGHRPLYVSHLGGCLEETRFSDAQELEANSYALALLLPYAPLTQLLDQGATLAAIAFHYGVSVEAVEMRLKLVGLWSTRTSR